MKGRKFLVSGRRFILCISAAKYWTLLGISAFTGQQNRIMITLLLSVIRAEPHKTELFKYDTELTRAGKSIREFHRSLDPMNWMGFYERAVYMMKMLNDEFRYKPGVTGILTTAEEAFSLRRGVCQDYAHILLAMCRLERIPCRYVAGMIPGEGATHETRHITVNAMIRISRFRADGTHKTAQ